jgi:O-antigen ligase
MQRALSFVPAKWDADAVADAQGTTEWRVNIWKTVLTTNKYIDNKVLGDGFGYSRAQYQQMIINGNSGLVGENQMISGDYHSGPVSTIRFVGVVGLALFYVLLIALAREAWRIVRLTTDTPFFILALFVCCPIIYEPFNFTFVFGAFQTALPTALFSVGMLRMLSNSLEVWRAPAPAKIEDQRPISRMRRAPRREPAGAGASLTVRPRSAT